MPSGFAQCLTKVTKALKPRRGFVSDTTKSSTIFAALRTEGVDLTRTEFGNRLYIGVIVAALTVLT